MLQRHDTFGPDRDDLSNGIFLYYSLQIDSGLAQCLPSV